MLKLLLVLSLSIPLSAQWSMGINFRATSGYVTNGGDEVFSDMSEAYPTSRTTGNGSTANVGYTAKGSATNGVLDRSTSVDRRLAGVYYIASGGTSGQSETTYRIELPATGDYTIRVALGDMNAGRAESKLVLKDNATTFATLTNGSANAADFMDASGVIRTDATWPASNVAITRTFLSTTFFFTIGNTTGVDYSTLAHVSITQVGGAPARRRQPVVN